MENIQDKGKEVLKTSIGLELRDWRFPFIDFTLFGILPADPHETTAIKRKAPHFYNNVTSWTLHRCTLDRLLLCCLSSDDAQEVFKEAHNGTCGAHQSGSAIKPREGAIIGPKCSLTPSNMQSSATIVKFTEISSIELRDTCIQQRRHGNSKCEGWTSSVPLVSYHPKDIGLFWQ